MNQTPPLTPSAYSAGSEPSSDAAQSGRVCSHDWIDMGDHQRCGRCYARNPALPAHSCGCTTDADAPCQFCCAHADDLLLDSDGTGAWECTRCGFVGYDEHLAAVTRSARTPSPVTPSQVDKRPHPRLSADSAPSVRES